VINFCVLVTDDDDWCAWCMCFDRWQSALSICTRPLVVSIDRCSQCHRLRDCDLEVNLIELIREIDSKWELVWPFLLPKRRSAYVRSDYFFCYYISGIAITRALFGIAIKMFEGDSLCVTSCLANFINRIF
jgi:hypothetical protein